MHKMCYKIDHTRIVTSFGFEKVWCRFPNGMILSFRADEPFYEGVKRAMVVWVLSLNPKLNFNPAMLIKNMKVEHCK